jgi:hypothetical protein
MPACAHRLQGRLHLPGFDADHGEARSGALDVDHPKPAHDLGDAASVVAIGLVP